MDTYNYQWQRANPDESSLTDILGASGSVVGSPPTTFSESYTLTSADLGKIVRVKVTDTVYGITSYSAWSATVVAAPTPTVGGGFASEIYWGALMEGPDTYGSGYSNTPWDSNTWDKFEANAGKTVSICHFGQPFWQCNTGPLNDCWARGAAPMVDYGSSSPVSLIDVANGLHDTAITAWANAYKSWGKPCFIRLWWEMNQYGSHWFPWAVPYYYSAAQYVAAWRHVVSICNSVGATNMTFVWCPNFIRTDSSRVAQLLACYPGDAYVDWNSFDGYNDGTPTTTFHNLYDLTYNTILTNSPTKPIMIGEFSSRDTSVFASGVKASWFTDALTNQIPVNYPAIKAVVHFNWKIPESGEIKDWHIESSTSAQSAFAAAIADSYYKSKFLATPPSLAKVPIPT